MAHAERERAARGAEIKQAIKNTACSDAAAAPWELALYICRFASCVCVSTPPAGLRSQPHEFNKIIKYLSAPVALLSVHASFKNFASLNLLLRISSRCMHKSRRAHYILRGKLRSRRLLRWIFHFYAVCPRRRDCVRIASGAPRRRMHQCR